MPLIHANGNAPDIVYQKLGTESLFQHFWIKYRQSSIMYQSSRFEKSSSEALLPVLETQDATPKHTRTPRKYFLLITATIFCFLIFFSNALPACLQQTGWRPSQQDNSILHESKASSRLDDFRTCSIKNFESTEFPFLHGVQPIARDEFVARRQRLAEALLSDGADAFAVEPGKSRRYSRYCQKKHRTNMHFFSDRLHFLILREHNSTAMGSVGARGASVPHDHPAWSEGRSEDNVSRSKLRSRACSLARHAFH